MKFEKILVSQKSFDSDDSYDIIHSNATVINLLREEGMELEHLHEDSVKSYFVDYYLSQYNNGNFPQYVWNTQHNHELHDLVKQGLTLMGANKHMEFFKHQCDRVDTLCEDLLQDFLQNEYFGDNPTRDALKSGEFYDIDENIMELNAQWLRNHPDLQVKSIDGMFEEIEQFLGRPVER